MKGDSTDSLESVRDNLKRMQVDVGKAKKVVVIGGGPVGLEYAGVSDTVLHLSNRIYI
jgi:pyruvate/2-oxoglutarate dehydrogenase complex dihydrolipoamide dehydrogenase (E3) component